MTFREIANNIDKSDSNVCYFHFSEIANAVGLEYYGYTEDKRMQSFWIAPWYDYDS